MASAEKKLRSLRVLLSSDSMPNAFRNAEAGLQVVMKMRLSTSKVQPGRCGRPAGQGLSGLQASLLVFVALGGVVVPSGVAAQKYRGNATATEITQLPKYCYAQYVSDKLSNDPNYSVIRQCGPFMNHLCTGLIALMRAKKPSATVWQRAENVAAARRDFAYTLGHMPPDCGIRGEVEGYAEESEKIAATIR